MELRFRTRCGSLIGASWSVGLFGRIVGIDDTFAFWAGDDVAIGLYKEQLVRMGGSWRNGFHCSGEWS